ncbi:hypothetical protein LLG88_03900, partial [bacterium]|nr:hypothetical protein [bacterium]
MDLDRFTEKAREALEEAQREAVRRGHQQVEDLHLLAALLAQERGFAPALLAKAGLDVAALG